MEVNQTLLPPHPCYSHYELPRLHIPSSSQPQSSSPCHWKTAASQPVSRMRMMANFFRPPHKSSSPPASSIVPSTTGTRLLPSFHEMLSRTKNLVLQREIHSNTEPFDQHKTYNNHWRSQAPPPLDMEMITSDCTSVTIDGSEDPSFVSTPTTTLYTTQNGKCTSKRRERWTEEEHVRFLDGLHRYGRKWKKIQLVVPTKTAIQIRTHAYGFFAKLVRNMPENESNCSSTASKRRMEPLTDANGMDILRRFVFPKRFSIETKEEGDATTPSSSPTQNEEQSSPLVEWNRLEEQHE